MGDCRRPETGRRKAAPAANINSVPDEILELVFLHLRSPLYLIRAACTCRRWRHVIGADGGRLIHSLHGTPSFYAVGHYRVNKPSHPGMRPPGSNPVFVPSSSSQWADILAKRNFALDFIPKYGHCCWALSDVRDGLLLLLSPLSRPRILVCDPLVRRYIEIPPSPLFDGCDFLGVFILDGEDPGAHISLSNFRVSCVLYHSGVIRACTFSSACGGHWTYGSGRSDNAVIYRNGYWGALGGCICFIGCNDNGSVAYWTMGKDGTILAFDKNAIVLSSYVMQDKMEHFRLRSQHHVPKYVCKLLWPPTIKVCLS
jgi:hypothetical protein